MQCTHKDFGATIEYVCVQCLGSTTCIVKRMFLGLIRTWSNIIGVHGCSVVFAEARNSMIEGAVVSVVVTLSGPKQLEHAEILYQEKK